MTAGEKSTSLEKAFLEASREQNARALEKNLTPPRPAAVEVERAAFTVTNQSSDITTFLTQALELWTTKWMMLVVRRRRSRRIYVEKCCNFCDSSFHGLFVSPRKSLYCF